MNRDKFIGDEKIKPPVKPSFVPTGIMTRGDKVVNVEILYTPYGYYEIGCEWMVSAFDPDKHKIWVNQIINEDVKAETKCFPIFFQIKEKDWIKKYDKSDNKQQEEQHSFYSPL